MMHGAKIVKIEIKNVLSSMNSIVRIHVGISILCVFLIEHF